MSNSKMGTYHKSLRGAWDLVAILDALLRRGSSLRIEGLPELAAVARSPHAVKHVIIHLMKTVTVRDLRQRWPETEKALQEEREILITRDSKPVAKLVLYVEPKKSRKRFDPEAHGDWQRKMSGGKMTRWVDEGLLRERDER